MRRTARALVAALAAGCLFAAPAAAQSPDLVISQVYGGGGNTGATFTHDFIELYNRGSAAATLGGKSLQYASGTGSGNLGGNAGQLTELPDVTLQPGQYFLVQQGAGAGNGAPLPAPDLTDDSPMSMAAGSGKVALAEGTESLGCNGSAGQPCSDAQLARIVDLVGYGGANFFEGTGAAPALSNSTAAFRVDDGGQDTDDNAADFTADTPAPRNSGTDPDADQAPTVASSTPAGGASGVALDSDLELTFSEPVDAAPSAFALACSRSGDHAVTLTGGPTTFTVDPAAGFENADECTLTVSAAGVTDLDTDDPPDAMAADATIEFTTVRGLTLIHEIQGDGATSPLVGETVTIEGVVTGVDDEVGANFERIFPGDAGIFVQEEPGDADGDPATSDGIFVSFVRPRSLYPPGTVVRLEGRVVEQFQETRVNLAFGTEPEIVGTAPVPAPVVIDPAAARSQPTPERPYYESLEGMNVLIDVATATSGGRNRFGETFLTLGVNQDPEDRVFRTEPTPELIAADSDAGAGDPSNPLEDTDSTTELPMDLFDVVRNLQGPLGFSFSHYKVINQPENPPVIEQGPTEYPYDEIEPRREDQLRVASFNVENFFPPGSVGDIGHVRTQEEYEEQRGRIADAIADQLERPDVVAVQEVATLEVLQDLADELGGYTAYLEPGNDERGIDVGFLVRDTVRASNLRQLGKDAAGPEGFTCSDVPGGLFDRPPLAIDIARRGVEFTVFSNHFSSKSAPDECRAAQAAFVRDEVARIEAAGGEALVAGDLNAFETESALTTLEDGTTTLDNLWDEAPEFERYSYHFDGRLQTLDHILVTDGLHARVEDFRYAHFDNDYYERRNTPEPDGHALSDHDPPIVTLDLPGAPVNVGKPAIERRIPRKPVTRNELLLGSRGDWEVDEGELAFAYQWLRCRGDDCAEIDGATEAVYRVAKADKGHTLVFRVTATSAGGEATAESAPAGPVYGGRLFAQTRGGGKGPR